MRMLLVWWLHFENNILKMDETWWRRESSASWHGAWVLQPVSDETEKVEKVKGKRVGEGKVWDTFKKHLVACTGKGQTEAELNFFGGHNSCGI